MIYWITSRTQNLSLLILERKTTYLFVCISFLLPYLFSLDTHTEINIRSLRFAKIVAVRNLTSCSNDFQRAHFVGIALK